MTLSLDSKWTQKSRVYLVRELYIPVSRDPRIRAPTPRTATGGAAGGKPEESEEELKSLSSPETEPEKNMPLLFLLSSLPGLPGVANRVEAVETKAHETKGPGNEGLATPANH